MPVRTARRPRHPALAEPWRLHDGERCARGRRGTRARRPGRHRPAPVHPGGARPAAARPGPAARTGPAAAHADDEGGARAAIQPVVRRPTRVARLASAPAGGPGRVVVAHRRGRGTGGGDDRLAGVFAAHGRRLGLGALASPALSFSRAALQEIRVRLVEAFESSESIVALLSADDGRFIEVNPAFYQITGYTPEQVVGRIPIDVGLWEDLEFRTQLWESLRVERRIVDAAAKVHCADGRVLNGKLHVELLPGGERSELFCLLQILPDDYPQQIAQRHESLYRDLFLSASEGIYRSLPDGGFIDANPAMARILGYDSPAELLLAHSSRARAIYVDQRKDAVDNDLLLQQGRIDQVRVQVYRRDGSRIWVSENARVVKDSHGKAVFFEGTMEDITAQVEAEQALKQSQALYQVLLDN